MGNLANIEVPKLLLEARNERVFSGAQALWGNLSGCDTLWSHSEIGTHSWNLFQPTLSRPINRDSVFDLASMTKALVTAPLIFEQIENNNFQLESTLGNFFPNLSPALKQVTLSSLLNHTSGLLWWHLNAFLELEKFEPIPEQIGKVVYSDLGFMWLTRVLEKVSGMQLDKLASEKLFKPLRLENDLVFKPIKHSSVFDPATFFDPNTVATEICPWRGWLQGQVHDDNAFAMGGVSGHSGLFGSALSVSRFIKCLYEGKILKYQTLRTMWSRSGTVELPRTYGWDCPSPDGLGSAGFNLNDSAVGHLGFTGTSVWIELDTGRFGVLLTNRVHPTRSDLLSIRRLRRAFYDTIFSI